MPWLLLEELKIAPGWTAGATRLSPSSGEAQLYIDECVQQVGVGIK